MQFGHGMLQHWMLDPDVTYLNHGTVGAVPRSVLAAQQALRDELERQPSRFMLRELSSLVGLSRREPTRVREAAHTVAAFVGARGRVRDLMRADGLSDKVGGLGRVVTLASVVEGREESGASTAPWNPIEVGYGNVDAVPIGRRTPLYTT